MGQKGKDFAKGAAPIHSRRIDDAKRVAGSG
jgi:hypothetical protein